MTAGTRLSGIITIHKKDLILRHLLLFLIVFGRHCHQHCVEDNSSNKESNKKWQDIWCKYDEKYAYKDPCAGNCSAIRGYHLFHFHPENISVREENLWVS